MINETVDWRTSFSMSAMRDSSIGSDMRLHKTQQWPARMAEIRDEFTPKAGHREYHCRVF